VVPLPGFGAPARAGTPLDPRTQARRLLAALPDTAWSTLLLGHSASCQLVVEAAALAPDRVAGLVLVGPTTDPRAAGTLALALRWSATATAEPPWQLPLLLRDYRHTGFRTMAAAMGSARRHRIDEALDGVSCPVLVVRGGRDRIVPADWARRLARHAPRGRTATVPGPAHMLPLTHPGLLADLVSRVWNEISSRPEQAARGCPDPPVTPTVGPGTHGAGKAAGPDLGGSPPVADA
jgi:pimeloyl-ACP methyl ester carboxylesterase